MNHSSVENPEFSGVCKIACAMEDEYAWDLIRQQQIPGIEFEVWEDCLAWEEDTYAQRLREVTAIVTGRQSRMLPESLIQDRGNFQAVFHCHGGVRGLVSLAHLESGILISNWGFQAGGSVADSALMLLLACLKQLRGLHAWSVSGKEEDPRIYQNYHASLFGGKVGLYGFGPIGKKMAALLEPFHPKLAIYDPYATDVPEDATICESLEELFDLSDMVSIHCGLNEYTRNTVTGDLLDRLPQGGVLVNTARGEIVDEDALAERVHAGRLLAGLDVIRGGGAYWGKTPLVGTTNAILTGHRASGGKGWDPGLQGPKLLPDFVVHNIKALVAGEPFVNLITPEKYVLKT
jgi:phosphoglycerate dehydrogenase-like enzyme